MTGVIHTQTENVDNSATRGVTSTHPDTSTESRPIDTGVGSGARAAGSAGAPRGLPPLTEQELWTAYGVATVDMGAGHWHAYADDGRPLGCWCSEHGWWHE
jgi:hypothetical protein